MKLHCWFECNVSVYFYFYFSVIKTRTYCFSIFLNKKTPILWWLFLFLFLALCTAHILKACLKNNSKSPGLSRNFSLCFTSLLSYNVGACQLETSTEMHTLLHFSSPRERKRERERQEVLPNLRQWCSQRKPHSQEKIHF